MLHGGNSHSVYWKHPAVGNGSSEVLLYGLVREAVAFIVPTSDIECTKG